ncbi:MAG: threonine/serine exporter family protein [Selenomonadaceae bacterium]|nr:threonine/serine exporter family protein [Selenomonadaceae bacterium]MBQ1509875.1 threonine/serine exporter family protein [Selenomonadaceae bacterium]
MTHTQEDHIAYPYRRIMYKMQLILMTGELLMANGAATERIMRDMLRAATYMDITSDKISIHVNYTTLMLNINDDDHSYTEFRKCRHHGVNMTVLADISNLTWTAIKENYSLERYEEELHRLEHMPSPYPPLLSAISAGLACGGICKLFGCDWISFFCTVLSAAIGFAVRRLCNIYGFNVYAGTAISAFAATALACFFQSVSGTSTPSYPMIAAALFLIPGIPLINAVDDMLNNYIMAGTTRLTHTMLIIGSMTFGISIALWVGNVTDFTRVPIQPEDIYLSQTLAAALAGAGYAAIFNLPGRLLPVVALGAVIAVDVRNLMVIQLDSNLVAGSFLGAAILGVAAQKAIHWFHTPGSVLTIPSVIPLMPGVLLYRLLFSILNITTIDAQTLLVGIRSGVEAATVVIAMAVGVTIPTIFFRPRLEKYQRQQMEKLLLQRYDREN